jgi:predicted  nucleic acid-binding Zn-ribbon protein
MSYLLKHIEHLEDSIVEVEWEVEDLKAAIREAEEEGGDIWIHQQLLDHAEEKLGELKDELAFCEYRYTIDTI